MLLDFPLRELLPAAIALLAIVVLLLWATRHRGRHKRYVGYADKALHTLAEIPSPARQFGYLRKINPFVFEEMVLSALNRAGYRIRRNTRYTDDGGVDGRCWIEGVPVLIQSKRYKNHISRRHVREFLALCQKYGCKGLFVHTGRTGEGSWEAIADCETLEIVSGERLLDLLVRRKFKPNWKN